jgi:hypothetical protein
MVRWCAWEVVARVLAQGRRREGNGDPRPGGPARPAGPLDWLEHRKRKGN